MSEQKLLQRISELEQALSQAGDNIELQEVEQRGFERGLAHTGKRVNVKFPGIASAVRRARRKERARTIEECAQVAEASWVADRADGPKIAERIRALPTDRAPPILSSTMRCEGEKP